MNRAILKLTVGYWMSHKKRLFIYVLIITFGVAALVSVALLLRSEKMANLDIMLNNGGDYDVIIYNVSQDDSIGIMNDKDVAAAGRYYELGYVVNGSGKVINAAAFADAVSENIYHIPCIRGNYPETENEIAIDLNTAKSMGIKPYPGEKVKLELLSYDNKTIVSGTFCVSGIYELSRSGVVGGWLRYPASMNEEDVRMPGIFFFGQIANRVENYNSVVYFQTNNPTPSDVVKRLVNAYDSVEMDKTEMSSGREFAYSMVLSDRNTIVFDGEASVANLKESMKKGQGVRDFYSGVVLPVFSFLIVVVIVLSIMGIALNILRDKRENYAILRCLGIDRSKLIRITFVDFMIVAVVFTAIGEVVGCLLHILMISIVNNWFGLQLVYGFNTPVFINAVTFNPFVYSAVLVLGSVVVAVIISSVRYLKQTPIELLSEKERRFFAYSDKKIKKYRNWRSLLSGKLDIYSHSVAVICIIFMSSAVLGYTFFRAYSDMKNQEYVDEKKNFGLEEWDYTANISSEQQLYSFGIENHHDQGVSREAYEELCSRSEIKSIFGKIVSRSTRLSFWSDDIDKEMVRLISDINLRRTAGKADTVGQAVVRADEAMINSIGYSPDEAVYSTPTVGLSAEEISKMEKYVVAGKIDLKKIDDGEEVVLAVAKGKYEKLEQLLQVGTELPLSDVILSDYEEALDFNQLTLDQLGEPVYSEVIQTEDGGEFELTSYAIGKRYDITTRVGAILVLDEEMQTKYMSPVNNGIYAVNLICSFDTFKKWGLPNHNFASLGLELSDSVNAEDFDLIWYKVLSDSKGLDIKTITEINQRINSGRAKIMCIYYSVVLVLLFLSVITTAVILYLDLRIHGRKFAVLRASGMSVGQLRYLMIRQNLIYPVVGILFSLIPVAVCQKFFDYTAKMLDSGKWGKFYYDVGEKMEWYHFVPVRYKLYSYNLPLVLTVVSASYTVIVVGIVLLQMRIISKKSVVEELEKTDF